MTNILPVTSGTTAKATTTDEAVEAIAARTDTNFPVAVVSVVNESTNPGWVSIDAGTTWLVLPSGVTARQFKASYSGQAVQIKRRAGGSNLTGVFIDIVEDRVAT